jgi:hypothetical protein
VQDCNQILRTMLARCWGSPRGTKDFENIIRCPPESALRETSPCDSEPTSSGTSTCSGCNSIGTRDDNDHHDTTAEQNTLEEGCTSLETRLDTRSLPRQSVASNLSWEDDLAAVPQELHISLDQRSGEQPEADPDDVDGYTSSGSLPSTSQLFPRSFNMYIHREDLRTSWYGTVLLFVLCKPSPRSC